MRSKGGLLARLDRTERTAETVALERAAAASEERKRLIASWRRDGPPPGCLVGMPEQEVDRRLLVMAEEYLYRYELANGPVPALFPAPDVTPEEWAARTDADVAGYSKGILTQGLSAEWKRPREWLAETSMTDTSMTPEQQAARPASGQKEAE